MSKIDQNRLTNHANTLKGSSVAVTGSISVKSKRIGILAIDRMRVRPRALPWNCLTSRNRGFSLVAHVFIVFVISLRIIFGLIRSQLHKKDNSKKISIHVKLKSRDFKYKESYDHSCEYACLASLGIFMQFLFINFMCVLIFLDSLVSILLYKLGPFFLMPIWTFHHSLNWFSKNVPKFHEITFVYTHIAISQNINNQLNTLNECA